VNVFILEIDTCPPVSLVVALCFKYGCMNVKDVDKQQQQQRLGGVVDAVVHHQFVYCGPKR